MIEDIKIITERPVFIEPDYREFTSFSDIDEMIIWEAELNILTFGDDLSGIYNKSGLSSKKCKYSINIRFQCLGLFILESQEVYRGPFSKD